MMRSKKITHLAVFMSAVLATAAADAQTLTTLYNFKGQGDGANPLAGLIYHQGSLYGTTERGGASDAGTVFTLDLARGNERVLHSFAAPGSGVSDGAYPQAPLLYRNGFLYGTTPVGGPGSLEPSDAAGTVYSVNLKTGVESLLHSFTGSAESFPDGANPYSGLIYRDGALYGTAEWNGTSLIGGTVFKIDPNTGQETVIYGFSGGADGEGPVGNLLYLNGALYGTTEYGGTSLEGNVFKIDLATGAETVLYSFVGLADGGGPTSNLTYHNGKLYGTTLHGGEIGEGTVFSIDLRTGRETVLHSFSGVNDGAYPQAGLIYRNGNLYGTTVDGGVPTVGVGQGIVFAINVTTGVETVLYSFVGGSDGAHPQARLIELNGSFYGTTSGGGAYGLGTVFKLTL